MGARASTDRYVENGDTPLIQGIIIPETAGNTTRFSNGSAAAAAAVTMALESADDGEVCAICLSGMSRAVCFQLPGCRHEFHSLCLASSLHCQMLCPICRAEVAAPVGHELAHQLMNDPSHGGRVLAAELLLGLRTSGAACTEDSEISAEATVEALKRATRRGDASKIPSVAALLGRGSGAVARSAQPTEVRLAAVEALRTLVPGYPRTWPGTPHVLALLRSAVISDPSETVRIAAMKALREVGERGEAETLLVLQQLFQDRSAGPEVRVEAANTLQGLAARQDLGSIRAAMVAAQDKEPGARSAALSTLKYICAPRGTCADVVPELAQLAVNHREPEVRVEFLDVLSNVEEIGGHCGLTAAAAAANDSHEEVRTAALSALRRLWRRYDPEAVSMLIAWVGSRQRDSGFRREALNALAHIATKGDLAVVSVATNLLPDEDAGVRLAAMQVLKNVVVKGDDEMVALILVYVEHKDMDVKRLAIEALAFSATPQNQSAVAALRVLKDSDDLDVMLPAEQALRQMGAVAL